jgi:hypothetical protein
VRRFDGSRAISRKPSAAMAVRRYHDGRDFATIGSARGRAAIRALRHVVNRALASPHPGSSPCTSPPSAEIAVDQAHDAVPRRELIRGDNQFVLVTQWLRSLLAESSLQLTSAKYRRSQDHVRS